MAKKHLNGTVGEHAAEFRRHRAKAVRALDEGMKHARLGRCGAASTQLQWASEQIGAADAEQAWARTGRGSSQADTRDDALTSLRRRVQDLDVDVAKCVVMHGDAGFIPTEKFEFAKGLNAARARSRR